jgi:hypothetical protein
VYTILCMRSIHLVVLHNSNIVSLDKVFISHVPYPIVIIMCSSLCVLSKLFLLYFLLPIFCVSLLVYGELYMKKMLIPDVILFQNLIPSLCYSIILCLCLNFLSHLHMLQCFKITLITRFISSSLTTLMLHVFYFDSHKQSGYKFTSVMV